MDAMEEDWSEPEFQALNSKYAPFNWWTPGPLTYILKFFGNYILYGKYHPATYI